MEDQNQLRAAVAATQIFDCAYDQMGQDIALTPCLQILLKIFAMREISFAELQLRGAPSSSTLARWMAVLISKQLVNAKTEDGSQIYALSDFGQHEVLTILRKASEKCL